jgi:type IV pilus assembly protein PilA
MLLTTKQAAFTLIEVMVTLVIVLVLSVIAYPALNRSIIQSKVTDALNGAAEVQTMIVNQIATNETVTGSGNNLTTPASLGRNVSSFSVSSNGVITIVTISSAGSITLTLTPTYNSSAQQVTWLCAVNSSSNNEYVPPQCRI